MNGAELPCGATLQVQPADSNYRNNQQHSMHNSLANQQPSKQGNPEEPTMCENTVAEVQGDTDLNDDLDDFFGSLE